MDINALQHIKPIQERDNDDGAVGSGYSMGEKETKDNLFNHMMDQEPFDEREDDLENSQRKLVNLGDIT